MTGLADFSACPTSRSEVVAERVYDFVREVVVPYERDTRWSAHGPGPELVEELRYLAQNYGVLSPHVLANGEHMSHLETSAILKRCGWSPLGPTALNVMAPDEGNMYLLSKIATAAQRERYLSRLISGATRSAFMMTEPSSEGGAGSDPSMLKTTATKIAGGWRIRGRKAFITGAVGAGFGIVMARTGDDRGRGATMFLVDMPNPKVRIERVIDTLDGSMPGGHSIVLLDDVEVRDEQVLGEVDEGFKYAQVRLSPARLTHCMRWLGAARRAQACAAEYAATRHAFGRLLIEHEGVGFMLVENAIELRQAELLIDWCAGVLDAGGLATAESSMAKVGVSEILFKVVDRCMQVMGGTGTSGDAIVERIFREVRAFRIYDGPTEVHKWSLAKQIKRSIPAPSEVALC